MIIRLVRRRTGSLPVPAMAARDAGRRGHTSHATETHFFLHLISVYLHQIISCICQIQIDMPAAQTRGYILPSSIG
jgi:hypothetical protein